ncbi:MAG TPA: Ku protein [Acidisarcina sp.]|nr:Ku protein [Acidisarcina sp.]
MASTVWKGYITFGLISVPVRLFAAARETHISFNQIHEVCGTRIKQQLYCPHCERVVERSELAKGYPVDKDTYVLVSDEELKGLQAESSEAMEILQFVKLDDIDPIYFETSYYSVAEEPGRRAYALLMQGMERLQVAAIAKLTMHQREQVVLIRPYHKGLVLHTLYYASEVREVSEFGKDEDLNLQPQEVQLAEQFMKQLTGHFQPEQFKDEYESRVEKLVESKGAGQLAAPAQTQHRRLAPVINLMDALKKSIEARQMEEPKVQGEKKPPKKVAVEESRAERKSAPQRKRKAG